MNKRRSSTVVFFVAAAQKFQIEYTTFCWEKRNSIWKKDKSMEISLEDFNQVTLEKSDVETKLKTIKKMTLSQFWATKTPIWRKIQRRFNLRFVQKYNAVISDSYQRNQSYRDKWVGVSKHVCNKRSFWTFWLIRISISLQWGSFRTFRIK